MQTRRKDGGQKRLGGLKPVLVSVLYSTVDFRRRASAFRAFTVTRLLMESGVVIYQLPLQRYSVYTNEWGTRR